MQCTLKLFALATLATISSASAVTFVNNRTERVILHDFTFNHNREIALKPIILQKNTPYENSEIESCIADLETESIKLGTLRPECFVVFEKHEVLVAYPLEHLKNAIKENQTN
ncbi:MAG: hypothetical protein ACOYT8_05160 [Candidatus Dependentiae bacterium]